MRIYFISENYFPNISGVPVVVKYLAEGLVLKGHIVHVVTTQFSDSPKCEVINEVIVHRFGIYKNFWHIPSGTKEEYINFVKGCDADILIFECSQCVTTDLLLPYIKELPGKKIFHSHGFSGLIGSIFSIKPSLLHTLGTTYNWINSQLYFRYTFRKVISMFDCAICLSSVDNSYEYLTTHCSSCYILGNAADNMFFSKVEDNVIHKYANLKNYRYLMSCANYTFVKNQIDILNQYYRSESSKDFSLVCIGTQKTPYYYECLKLREKLDRQYGKRDVHFLTGIDRKDVPSIVKGASLYLVASRYEQYSISIIEAMSQGVPFISTDVGNSRILPGGVIVHDVEGMHKEIDLLLSDTRRYATLSAEGRKFAYKNCRIETAVNALHKIIEII